MSKIMIVHGSRQDFKEPIGLSILLGNSLPKVTRNRNGCPFDIVRSGIFY